MTLIVLAHCLQLICAVSKNVMFYGRDLLARRMEKQSVEMFVSIFPNTNFHLYLMLSYEG